jgi:hypothetical protein
VDAGGRVEELARMLGGEAVSDGLRESAREMLAERSKAGQRSRPVQAPRLGTDSARLGQAKAKGERRKS